MTKDIRFEGQLFRGRKIVAEEEMLRLILKVPEAIVTWGWRSKEQQAEMVKKGTSKTMDSNHRRGVAFDIWNWQQVEKKMKALGFVNDLKPWDPGHFTPGGEEAARKKYKIIDSLPKDLQEYKEKPVAIPPVTSTKPEEKLPSPTPESKEPPKVEPATPVSTPEPPITVPPISQEPEIGEGKEVVPSQKNIIQLIIFLCKELYHLIRNR